MEIKIRDFQPQDLSLATRLLQEAFADSFRARGFTPEAFANQMRLITRGRMVPFKILTALGGVKWAIFVAESDNEIIGLGAYYGTVNQVTLGPFAISPAYRRHGIAKALGDACQRRLLQQRCQVVVSTVLENNIASSTGLTRYGFEVFAYSVAFDVPLSLLRQAPRLASRPPRPVDRPELERLERRAFGDKIVELTGSEMRSFYPSLATRLQRRLGGTQVWTHVFESEGHIIGFARAYMDGGVRKGTVPAFAVDGNDPSLQLSVLREAAEWCASINPSIDIIRVTLRSETRPVLPPGIAEHASEMATFLEFVKRL